MLVVWLQFGHTALCLGAMAKLGQRYFESLKKNGTTEPFMEDMLNFSQLQHLLGTDDILARGKTYE